MTSERWGKTGGIMAVEKKWTIGELLGTSTGYWRGCTIQAAVRLDLFTKIGPRSVTGLALSQEMAVDERGLVLLLNALAALGLLSKLDDTYTNTEESQAYLSKDSKRYIGYIIMHHHHLLDGWAQLDLAVKSGLPIEKRSHGEEEERENFLMGMFNLAMGIAPGFAEQIDLAGRKQLLDLGGGPGTYAIHFCLKNHQMNATIYDRPTTEPFARKTVERFGLSDRIDFIGGDFTSDPINSRRYDAAWLSHILHSNSPEKCQNIIDKTMAVLEPGGVIMVHEFILENTKDGPQFPALFALNMLLSNDGRSYSDEEISTMLEKGGARKIKRLPVQGPNDSGVICGIV
ncbi:methyltransferase [Thermodesulfobacteriota bacterium]